MDTTTFDVQVVLSIDINQQLTMQIDNYLVIPFLSLCKHYLGLLLWGKGWRATEPDWTALTFRVPGLMRDVMSLKHLCRVTILQNTMVADVKSLPLPEIMKTYLTSGYRPGVLRDHSEENIA